LTNTLVQGVRHQHLRQQPRLCPDRPHREESRTEAIGSRQTIEPTGNNAIKL
jgi:hypothetical protein